MAKPVVIKIGGSTLGNHDTTLEDLVTLQRRGILPVVVHGGGNTVTQWLKRQNVQTQFVDGLRVTDEPTLQMAAAILGGLVNTDLVAAVNSLGGRAVGMTGVDGRLVESRIENPALGYVGKIVRVNPEVVQAILDAGFMPLIAPPCTKVSDEPTPAAYLNVNGDDMAGALAAALGAERLVFLTDVEGIRDQNGEVIKKLSADQVTSLIDSGVIAGGMIPKAQAALAALVTTPMVQIIDGRRSHALLGAIEDTAAGTTIS